MYDSEQFCSTEISDLPYLSYYSIIQRNVQNDQIDKNSQSHLFSYPIVLLKKRNVGRIL